MLKIFAVDSDSLALDSLCALINKLLPGTEVKRFLSTGQAYTAVSETDCDVLFVNILMEDKTGLELARRVRLIKSTLNIIFTVDSVAYAFEAMNLHASGYLIKPYTEAAVEKELKDLRYTEDERRAFDKRVRAQCFGNFELFVDGRAVRFKYKKTRELVAYLIDRCGSICTGPEITAVLWEEDMEEHPAYLKSLVRDLMKTLTELGCENIIEKQWGGLGIRTDLIECDYYNWRRGDKEGINTYRGEYMSQYSWGEFTNAGQMSSSGML